MEYVDVIRGWDKCDTSALILASHPWHVICHSASFRESIQRPRVPVIPAPVGNFMYTCQVWCQFLLHVYILFFSFLLSSFLFFWSRPRAPCQCPMVLSGCLPPSPSRRPGAESRRKGDLGHVIWRCWTHSNKGRSGSEKNDHWQKALINGVWANL